MLRIDQPTTNLSDKQLVAAIRDLCPGYDKTLHSKVKKPEKYGIRHIKEVERLLMALSLGDAAKPRRSDNRRLQGKITYRISNDRLRLLQQALKADGFDTMQGGMEYLVKSYLDSKDFIG